MPCSERDGRCAFPRAPQAAPTGVAALPVGGAAEGASSGAISVVTNSPVAVSNPVTVSTPVSQRNVALTSGVGGAGGGAGKAADPLSALLGGLLG